MASRLPISLLSRATRASPALPARHLAPRVTPPARFFSASSTRTASADAAAALSPSKPFGAFRGGVFGFLAGAAVAGGSIYYYVIDEYRSTNAQLAEDISALQTATRSLNSYLLELEQLVNRIQTE